MIIQTLQGQDTRIVFQPMLDGAQVSSIVDATFIVYPLRGGTPVITKSWGTDIFYENGIVRIELVAEDVNDLTATSYAFECRVEIGGSNKRYFPVTGIFNLRKSQIR